MAAKLFYCDPQSHVTHSYDELRRDLGALKSIPKLIDADDGYQVFVYLLAALQANATLAIGSDANTDLPADLFCSEPTDDRSWRAVSEHGPSSMAEVVLSSAAQIALQTSGTSGLPTWVAHQLPSLTRWVRVSEKHQHDVWGLAYQPSRFAGLQVFFQAVCNQNPLVRLFGMESRAVQAAIEDYEITHLSATPTFYKLLCTESVVHERVQRVTVGGEILDARLADHIHRTFPNAKLRNVYASTEGGSLLVADGEDFTVSDELAERIQVVEGELLIHRSLLALSLQPNVVGEYYATGDLVEVLSQSPLRIRFISRRSDVINVGGSKVNPLVVERMLLEQPQIAAARVYGQKNSVTGNLVCCDVVPAEGCSIDKRQLRQTLELRLQPFQVPRIVNIVAQIAVSAAGKTLRRSD